MKWQHKKIELVKNKVHRYFISEEGDEITFERFINLLSNSEDFRSYYNQILSDAPFEAYFWEHPPLSRESINRKYEFVLVKSNSLHTKAPDSYSFMDYFKPNKNVVVFNNLGGDAKLIVPCPIISDKSIYTHLASFVRKASNQQIDSFWLKLGIEIANILSEENRWISTSGLGVYWLHVRLDSFPKYYQYTDYKNIP